MTNQLTQAELINFATEAGILGHRVAGYGDGEFIYFTKNDEGLILTETLTKFAQLIQQRQGEVVAWQRKSSNLGWISVNQEDVDFYKSQGQEVRELFTASPNAPQLVAQALEKALGVVANELYRDGVPAFPLDRFEAISQGFRALIDQPVDHIPGATKMIEKPTENMLDAAVKFALQVSLSAEYSWRQYMADLYAVFMKHAPVKDSLTVEQGGDELDDVMIAVYKSYLDKSVQYATEFSETGDKEKLGAVTASRELLEHLKTRMTAVGRDMLRQALANRRGGE